MIKLIDFTAREVREAEVQERLIHGRGVIGGAREAMRGHEILRQERHERGCEILG